MKKSDYQRLVEIRDFLKIPSFNAFAKALGIKSAQPFYDIKAGKCGISTNMASKIKELVLNLNIEWLLTGEGEMLKAETPRAQASGGVLSDVSASYTSSPPQAEDVEIVETLEAIPVVSAEQAKLPNFDVRKNVMEKSPEIKRLSLSEFFDKFGRFDAISPIYSERMIPTYMPGDFLFIRYLAITQESYITEGRYLIDTIDHGSILAKVRDCEDGTLLLTFDNARKYGPMRLLRSDISSIAEIVVMMRMGDMAFDVLDVSHHQQQLDRKDEQFNKLVEQFNKTGDRVNRIIDQNQHLIENNQRMFETILAAHIDK